MRTLDETKGALTRLQQAYASENVKLVIAELKMVAEEKLMQDLLCKGEEAVRALGFQQGIGIINILPDILQSTIMVKEQQQTAQLKKKLQI